MIASKMWDSGLFTKWSSQRLFEECLLTAWELSHKYDPSKGTPLSFLWSCIYRIVYRRYMKEEKGRYKNKKGHWVTAKNHTQALNGAPAYSIHHDYEMLDLKELLQKEFSKRYYDYIIKLMHGYNQKELAALEGISSTAIYHHIDNIRQKLRSLDVLNISTG